MRVSVDAVGVLAPGLPDWETAMDILAMRRMFVPSSLEVPPPNCLAPAERRRSSPTVRLAIAVAEQALRQTALAPQDMAMVFSSYEAAGVITHQLCEALAGSREVSPTQFHNSVHNAPSGYYSISMNAQRAASSICRGEWSFAAGLLNAAAQAVSDQLPVLYVCYDSPLPSPMREVMPVVESIAIALVLTPNAGPASLATWELAIVPTRGAATWHEWIPSAWHANASARGFAALESLANPACTAIFLSLSPEIDLAVTRC
ncbi:MAG: beta-ketoacyl synthase chain length factor [Burkholderiales bacterium]|nr:beta-ketoacyl synthase chain length factor [Burkholderiales bacterium]